MVKLNGTRIGEDFTILHKLLTQYNFTKCTTVGPDSALVRSDTGLFYQYVDVNPKYGWLLAHFLYEFYTFSNIWKIIMGFLKNYEFSEVKRILYSIYYTIKPCM